MFRYEPNIEKHVWSKVIINCAYNSICPLLEVDNGVFRRDQKVLQLAKDVIVEGVELAAACGIDLDVPEIEQKLLLVSSRAEGQLISTFEDIRNKRPTEIDSLNLELARIADQMKKSNLVQKTRLLGELIAMKSRITR